MKYTVVLDYSQEDTVYLVNVPAFPEVHTYGAPIEEAASNTKEAIELAMEMYREEGKELPNDPTVTIKVAAYEKRGFSWYLNRAR